MTSTLLPQPRLDSAYQWAALILFIISMLFGVGSLFIDVAVHLQSNKVPEIITSKRLYNTAIMWAINSICWAGGGLVFAIAHHANIFGPIWALPAIVGPLLAIAVMIIWLDRLINAEAKKLSAAEKQPQTSVVPTEETSQTTAKKAGRRKKTAAEK